MFITIARVEYNELIRTKQQAESNVQYVSSLEHQISILSHDLHECSIRKQQIISKHDQLIADLKRQYEIKYEALYAEAEQTVLAEHEKLVKLQTERENVKT